MAAPPIPEEEPEGNATAEACKAAGNEHFKAGRYDEAAAHYTEAIGHDPTNAALFSNRYVGAACLFCPLFFCNDCRLWFVIGARCNRRRGGRMGTRLREGFGCRAGGGGGWVGGASLV